VDGEWLGNNPAPARRSSRESGCPRPTKRRKDQHVSLTMYSTPWCGYCTRLKRQLDREGIAFEEVDIEQVPAAADIVMQVNRGMQTVPTIVFADGSALTNPSLAQIKAKIA